MQDDGTLGCVSAVGRRNRELTSSCDFFIANYERPFEGVAVPDSPLKPVPSFTAAAAGGKRQRTPAQIAMAFDCHGRGWAKSAAECVNAFNISPAARTCSPAICVFAPAAVAERAGPSASVEDVVDADAAWWADIFAAVAPIPDAGDGTSSPLYEPFSLQPCFDIPFSTFFDLGCSGNGYAVDGQRFCGGSLCSDYALMDVGRLPHYLIAESEKSSRASHIAALKQQPQHVDVAAVTDARSQSRQRRRPRFSTRHAPPFHGHSSLEIPVPVSRGSTTPVLTFARSSTSSGGATLAPSATSYLIVQFTFTAYRADSGGARLGSPGTARPPLNGISFRISDPSGTHLFELPLEPRRHTHLAFQSQSADGWTTLRYALAWPLYASVLAAGLVIMSLAHDTACVASDRSDARVLLGHLLVMEVDLDDSLLPGSPALSPLSLLHPTSPLPTPLLGLPDPTSLVTTFRVENASWIEAVPNMLVFVVCFSVKAAPLSPTATAAVGKAKQPSFRHLRMSVPSAGTRHLDTSSHLVASSIFAPGTPRFVLLYVNGECVHRVAVRAAAPFEHRFVASLPDTGDAMKKAALGGHAVTVALKAVSNCGASGSVRSMTVNAV